jgi:hypothetical protein
VSDEFLLKAEEKAATLRAERKPREDRWKRIRAAVQAGAIPPPIDRGWGDLQCPLCNKKLEVERYDLERWYFRCDCGYEYAPLRFWTSL